MSYNVGIKVSFSYVGEMFFYGFLAYVGVQPKYISRGPVLKNKAKT